MLGIVVIVERDAKLEAAALLALLKGKVVLAVRALERASREVRVRFSLADDVLGVVAVEGEGDLVDLDGSCQVVLELVNIKVGQFDPFGLCGAGHKGGEKGEEEGFHDGVVGE